MNIDNPADELAQARRELGRARLVISSLQLALARKEADTALRIAELEADAALREAQDPQSTT